ncbi:L,D-transpeptidase [Maritimibacter sp. DP1N21-5]|uniref:L,D-transpeptidase n=1 Tax=Maritimibacter sp. DP1N21-5 TaxID=2836867 RepID=UPI001C46BA30|nr:L,D-transpeptidase [Maritimibacter sp. DP1N21-5]MBV7409150.1 L,D-transpeptidase [Maritimibacter sp. DP1N21-5]
MLLNLFRGSAACLGVALGFLTAPALADEVFSSSSARNMVVVRVDVSEQKLTVIQNGVRLYDWPVSTARTGKWTPRGTFQPQWFSPDHRSSKYNNAPMPWSVFYSGDYAIHGTDAVGRLGTPASAGCVRLSPENAKTLYSLIFETGKKDTFIVVQD